LKTYKDKHN